MNPEDPTQTPVTDLEAVNVKHPTVCEYLASETKMLCLKHVSEEKIC